MNSRIAFFPYSPSGVDYIVTMQCLLQKRFDIIDYLSLRNGILDVTEVDLIYLNWIEDILDETDRRILDKSKKAGIRIVWVFHNKSSHNDENREKSLVNLRFIADISDIIVLHAKNSGDILSEITKIHIDKNKLKYIPHPNYINDYRSYRYPGKSEIKLNRKKFTFAFIGAIRPYKNLEVLIEAYTRSHSLMNSQLIIAGEANSDKYVEKLKSLCNISDIIIYPHYIGALEMAGIIDKADILVLPYSLDSSLNSGTAIMAFSYEKSVIISDISMIYDFPEKLLFRYHYNDRADHIINLANQMVKAYKSGSEELIRRGKALKNFVSNYYSKDIVAESLMEICTGNGKL